MRNCYLLLCLGLVLLSCTTDKKEERENKTYRKFIGSYKRGFKDMQDVHIAEATKNGVGPLETRADTTKFLSQLVRLPQELEIYKLDNLSHSIPYLTADASQLLSDIGINFRDSLISKKMPLYKLIVTSVLRTDEDVKRLTKSNYNASDDSSHRYGTTFDIAWVRYQKADEADARNLDDGKLKLVLAEVLWDLRERERCYVKHERKQSCFHITVRK